MKRDCRATLAMTKESGFTLIEMLVVVSIVGILAAISTQIMFSIIRSNNKTNVLNEIKQNGSFALSLIERDIRASTTAVPTTPGTVLNLTSQDGTVTSYTCDTAANGFIRRNGNELLSTSGSSGTVKVSSCTFSVDPSSNPPLVTVDFTLIQSSNSPGRTDFSGSQGFHTTVSLRTY